MIRRLWRGLVDSREAIETRQQLRATRSTTLGAISEGVFGRVTGRCVAFDSTLLTAPFSERKCVAYVLFTDGRTAPFVERLGAAFLIEQDGQTAIVDPQGAQMSLSRTQVSRTREFRHPTPKQRALLDQIVGPGIVPDSISFTEAIIAYGDELVVAGFAVREVDREERIVDPYRGVPTRLRLIGARDQPLLIANDRRLI